MDTPNVQADSKPISAKQKKSILTIAGFMFLFALILLVLPSGFASAPTEESEPDYNLLIQESETNSAKWDSLEIEQDALEVRNAEIRTIVCKTGICDFR